MISFALTPHCSPVPQHPPAVAVPAVTQHVLLGAQLCPAYTWPHEISPAEQLSPCSRDPIKTQSWLQLRSGDKRVTPACAVVCGPAHLDFQMPEAPQNAPRSPGMAGFQGSTKLCPHVPYTTTCCWTARRNQLNRSSAPAEGYRAKAEQCPRCSAFSRIKPSQWW